MIATSNLCMKGAFICETFSSEKVKIFFVLVSVCAKRMLIFAKLLTTKQGHGSSKIVLLVNVHFSRSPQSIKQQAFKLQECKCSRKRVSQHMFFTHVRLEASYKAQSFNRNHYLPS